MLAIWPSPMEPRPYLPSKMFDLRGKRGWNVLVFIGCSTPRSHNDDRQELEKMFFQPLKFLTIRLHFLLRSGSSQDANIKMSSPSRVPQQWSLPVAPGSPQV